jgi:hypothetical protein
VEIHAAQQRISLELYDYSKDAVEVENIAGRPENAALIKQLSEQLAAGWRTEKL